MAENKTIKVMQERDMQKVSSVQRIEKILVQAALYIFLGVIAIIVLFPFYWMLISSVKSFSSISKHTVEFDRSSGKI